MPVNVRAGIVVTGTEVVNATITDRNSPWLSEQLAGLGVEVSHILQVGDRREDMEAALRFMADQGVDLVSRAEAWGRPPTT